MDYRAHSPCALAASSSAMDAELAMEQQRYPQPTPYALAASSCAPI